MTCRDFNDALLNRSLPPEAEGHLRTCDRCRELVGALERNSSDPPTPAALRDIETRLVSDLHAVSPIAAKPILFALIVLGFVVVVAASVYLIGAFTAMSLTQALAILAILAISLAVTAQSLVNQMIPGSRESISPVLLPLGILLVLAVAISALFPFQTEEDFWLGSWGCIRAGLPITVLAAVPIWVVLRKGAILSPILTTAAAGLLAGLAGTTVLEIHCPNLDAWHILLAHLGVAILGSLAGLMVGIEIENRRMPMQ